MCKPSGKRKRQHPLWIIFEMGMSIREVIFPVLIFFIFNARNEALWVKLGSIALILYIIYRIVAIIFQWKNHTYLFTDNNIEVVEGRFVVNKRYIALNRIQSYQQHTSFFHRLFKLTSLTILTGSSADNATIKLPMISIVEAEKIKELLKEYELRKQATAVSIDKKERSLPDNRKKHYRISFKEIIIISLTSLYFLAIFPILLSIYFKIDEIFSLDSFTNKAFAFLTQSWITIAIITIIAIGLAVISGIIITYLRYGNYEVFSDERQIYISKGVLNKTNYTIPRDKINGVTIERSFTRRFFRIVSVRFVTLGDLFDEVELETDVLFPFINDKKVKKLLPEIIPQFNIQEEMKSLPKKSLFVNLIQPSYLLVIVTFLVFFFWPEYWFIPLVLFVLIVLIRIVKTYQTKYIQMDQFIQFQTGAFSTELFNTRREKIDEIEIEQSWIEQKLQLATVTITSRAKPIYVSRIEHIPQQSAFGYYHWYKEEAQKIENERQ